MLKTIQKVVSRSVLVAYYPCAVQAQLVTLLMATEPQTPMLYT